MESVVRNNPKDEHILNTDDSVTNKDGDNYLEKGKQVPDQKDPDNEPSSTVTRDKDIKESEPSAEEKSSKKDGAPRSYAL